MVGMLLNFATAFVLTPLFAPPSSQVQDMIESLREPEGASTAVAIETAPEH